MRSLWIAVLLFNVFHAIGSESTIIALSNFDSEIQHDGLPDGFTAFGLVDAKGVTTNRSFSSPNSAYVMINFSATGFGAGLVRKPLSEPLDIRGATLSIDVMTTEDLSANLGHIAFRLVDADGTIMRSSNVDMYAPNESFTTFTQPAYELDYADERGSIPGLDFEKIVSYGVLIMNRRDLKKVVTYYLDNLAIVMNKEESKEENKED